MKQKPDMAISAEEQDKAATRKGKITTAMPPSTANSNDRKVHAGVFSFRKYALSCSGRYRRPKVCKLKCPTCGTFFTSRGAMKCHIEDIHFVCPKIHCEGVFMTESLLARHLKQKHTGRFKCCHCPKWFMFKSILE